MKRSTPYLLLTPLTGYFAAFLAIPLLIVARLSLSAHNAEGNVIPRFTLHNFAVVLDARYLDVFLRSCEYAGTATVLCLLLAYPLAYRIAMHGGRRRHRWLLMVMLPFWTSYLIRIYAWKALLASRGLVNLALMRWGLVHDPIPFLDTPYAVVLGLVYGFLPFMTLPIYVSLDKLDRTLVNAAEDLGASPAAAFWKVILPLSMPGVAAGAILTFIPAVGDFVTPDLLGGPENSMIGNVIESKFFPEQNWPVGAAIACVMMAMLLAVVLLRARAARAGESA